MPAGQTHTVPTNNSRARLPLLPVAARAAMSPVRWFILFLVGAAICASTFVLVMGISEAKGISSAADPAYDRTIRDRLKVASTSNEQALARYQSSLNDIFTKHQPRLDAMTKEAMAIATERRTLYPMLGYLARDRLRSTTKTEEWLHNRIGQTTVDPVLQAFLDDIAKEADWLQSELDKETARLAYDLAAKGSEVSSQSLRAKADTDFVDLFKKPADTSGKGAVSIVALSVFDAPAIARIGARVFSGQIGKLALVPVIAAADGPLPIGDVLAIFMGLWSAWELHRLDAQFQQEVSDSLTHHLGQFRESVLRDSRAFGASRLAGTARQQATVAADAAGHSLGRRIP